jgi:hypothetical protein
VITKRSVHKRVSRKAGGGLAARPGTGGALSSLPFIPEPPSLVSSNQGLGEMLIMATLDHFWRKFSLDSMKLSFHFAELAAQPGLSQEQRRQFSVLSESATGWGMIRICDGVGSAIEKALRGRNQ